MILDLLLLVPIAFGGYQGYKQGLLAQVVSLLHFVLAFMICFKAVGFLLRLINLYIFFFNEVMFPYIGFLLAIVATFVLLDKVGKHFKTEVDYDIPGKWDNIIGAVLGTLRYAFAASFILWFIEGFGTIRLNDGEGWQKKGVINPIVKSIALKVSGSQTQDQLARKIREAL
ncbi:MAG: CvpA family protein [Microscillaceae bacterium]|nr:CvpA family protein [Microscillaceae bacterium]MDW8460038.1 CvpA family protein [Cytophagales bacterium]